jgi:hypothetical protein
MQNSTFYRHLYVKTEITVHLILYDIVVSKYDTSYHQSLY